MRSMLPPSPGAAAGAERELACTAPRPPHPYLCPAGGTPELGPGVATRARGLRLSRAPDLLPTLPRTPHAESRRVRGRFTTLGSRLTVSFPYGVHGERRHLVCHFPPKPTCWIRHGPWTDRQQETRDSKPLTLAHHRLNQQVTRGGAETKAL